MFFDLFVFSFGNEFVYLVLRLECLVHFIEELSISLYELNHDWVNVLKFGLDDFLHLIVALIVDHLKGLECLIVLPLVLQGVRFNTYSH